MTGAMRVSPRQRAQPGLRRRCSWPRWSGRRSPGVADFNAQQVADGLDTGLAGSTTSPRRPSRVDVMENWQSEYLQFFLYIFATVWLVQRGSPESKEPGEEGTETDEEQRVGRHADDGLAGVGQGRGLADGGVLPVARAAHGRAVPADLGRLGGRRLGGVQQRPARRPEDPVSLLGYLGARRLLEPQLAELAVGDARRRLDGGLLRLPAPARIAGVQAGRGRARHDRPAETGLTAPTCRPLVRETAPVTERPAASTSTPTSARASGSGGSATTTRCSTS